MIHATKYIRVFNNVCCHSFVVADIQTKLKRESSHSQKLFRCFRFPVLSLCCLFSAIFFNLFLCLAVKEPFRCRIFFQSCDFSTIAFPVCVYNIQGVLQIMAQAEERWFYVQMHEMYVRENWLNTYVLTPNYKCGYFYHHQNRRVFLINFLVIW